MRAGEAFTADLLLRLLAEEFEKLRHAGNRDVHDHSKTTTLPVAREIRDGTRITENLDFGGAAAGAAT